MVMTMPSVTVAVAVPVVAMSVMAVSVTMAMTVAMVAVMIETSVEAVVAVVVMVIPVVRETVSVPAIAVIIGDAPSPSVEMPARSAVPVGIDGHIRRALRQGCNRSRRKGRRGQDARNESEESRR